MDTQYISTRIINDIRPILKEKGYKKLLDPMLFISLCELFYQKKLNNIQFRTILREELQTLNQ